MAKDYNCGSTVGWSGSKPTNLKSIVIGRTNGGWGSGGKPDTRGAAPPMPIIRVPKGAGLGNK